MGLHPSPFISDALLLCSLIYSFHQLVSQHPLCICSVSGPIVDTETLGKGIIPIAGSQDSELGRGGS